MRMQGIDIRILKNKKGTEYGIHYHAYGEVQPMHYNSYNYKNLWLTKRQFKALIKMMNKSLEEE